MSAFARYAVPIFALALVAFSQGNAQTAAPTCRVILGQVRAVGHGTVSSWVQVGPQGHPAAVGMTLSEDALSGLPDTHMIYELSFPPMADALAFTHLTLDWNPHGHIPASIYDVPHFDFHFYIITPAVRSGITATGEDLARVEKAPAPEMIPRGYVSTPGGEPHMGAHWIDPTSPEFHGQPFTRTFIYGFYDGRLAFFEPMASLAYLQTRPQFAAPIALPATYPTAGYYPTGYMITSDPVRRTVTIALTGLTPR